MTENSHLGNTFSQKVFDIMDRVEYRRVDTRADLEAVARIRHHAYTLANILSLDGNMLIDESDTDPNAFVFGVHYEGRLISTIRLHHVTPHHRVSTTRSIFPDEVDALLDDGRTLIDPVRLAADPEIVREMPAIPYLTLRLATMATDYFRADHVVQNVDPRHAAFYRRIFSAQVLADPQSNRGRYNIDLTLMKTDADAIRERLYQRYPFFRATAEERETLFGRGGTAAATSRPSARHCAERELA